MKQKPKEQALVVKLPHELHKKLKIYCTEKEIRIKVLITDLIKDYLN